MGYCLFAIRLQLPCLGQPLGPRPHRGSQKWKNISVLRNQLHTRNLGLFSDALRLTEAPAKSSWSGFADRQPKPWQIANDALWRAGYGWTRPGRSGRPSEQCMNESCVFVGPTRVKRADYPAIDFFPPAALGSVFRAMERGYRRIGIIDGFFGNTPSVWHKEILFAISKGFEVSGAASTGALR